MPTNERGPGMRLSSGPEHSLLTNRPVIVTQSDLLSSSPPPLQKRGTPYSRAVRRARTMARNGTTLLARPHQLRVRRRFMMLDATGSMPEEFCYRSRLQIEGGD